MMISPMSEAAKAGTESRTPYLTNLPKENGTPWSCNCPVHMMPAKAPVGVKNAPKFEPTTEAKSAAVVN